MCTYDEKKGLRKSKQSRLSFYRHDTRVIITLPLAVLP